MGDQRNTSTAMYEVKYQFTREELRELGLRLAAKAQEVYNARSEKKSMSSILGAKIEELDREAASLVRKLNELSEQREVECIVAYHEPRKGVKTITRKDTGELVREEAMTQAEMQSAFVFDDTPKPAEKPKDKPKPQ